MTAVRLRRRFPRLLLLAAAAALVTAPVARLAACPFCGAQAAQTLREEIGSTDIAVIARVLEDPKKPKSSEGGIDLSEDVEKTRFEVVHVLKGADALGGSKQFEVLFFGQEPKGTRFYLSATGKAPEINWTTPTPLSDAAVDYIKALPDLPEKTDERLRFYLGYLEHDDELIAADAYDEFARAAYDDVKALAGELDHDRVVALVKDPEISSSRRGLYLTLLGVCGGEEDAQMLEDLILDDDREVKPALDAKLACYLTLKGPEGMTLVEEHFLKNDDAPYSDTYAALQALRFHGQQESVVPRERILAGMRHMLDRPKLADLVIPDLARWGDWTVMDRLVKLFKDADEKSSWVRVPVVNYLRACPLPEAEKKLAELKKIDPDTVKQAMEFFPYINKVEDPNLAQGDAGEPADGETKVAAVVPEPDQKESPGEADDESAKSGAGKPAAEKQPADAIQGDEAHGDSGEQARAVASVPDESGDAAATDTSRGLPKGTIPITLAGLGVVVIVLGLLINRKRPAQSTSTNSNRDKRERFYATRGRRQ